MSRFGFGMLLAVGLLSSGCASTSTGRSQLMLVSQDQEKALGGEAYQQVLSESQLSNDAPMSAIVRRVGQRIAAAAERPDFDWEFNLIESPQVNAFCLPGGKIAIFTGILPVLQNEAGMAAVMGHEVAHALERHGAERMSQQLAAGALQQTLKFGFRGAGAGTQDVIMGVFGVGSQYGVLLPYSRAHELEADQVGLLLAAKAGYLPTEAVALWERMKASGGKKPPEILSTHPSEGRRIEQMQDFMSTAMQRYEQAQQQFGLGDRWAGSPEVTRR